MYITSINSQPIQAILDWLEVKLFFWQSTEKILETIYLSQYLYSEFELVYQEISRKSNYVRAEYEEYSNREKFIARKAFGYILPELSDLEARLCEYEPWWNALVKKYQATKKAQSQNCFLKVLKIIQEPILIENREVSHEDLLAQIQSGWEKMKDALYALDWLNCHFKKVHFELRELKLLESQVYGDNDHLITDLNREKQQIYTSAIQLAQERLSREKSAVFSELSLLYASRCFDEVASKLNAFRSRISLTECLIEVVGRSMHLSNN